MNNKALDINTNEHLMKSNVKSNDQIEAVLKHFRYARLVKVHFFEGESND